MKLKTKIIAGLALLPLLTCTSYAAPVVLFTTNSFNVDATILVQGSIKETDKTLVTAAPTKSSLNTKLLLSWLAQDEHVAGNFGFNAFTNATLTLISSNGLAFDVQVVDRNNVLLTDVSDILTVREETNVITSGTVNNSTGLNTKKSELRLVRLTFNDSTILLGGVGVNLTLTGLEDKTISNSNPARNTGVYKQTISAKVSDAVGDGVFQGQPFVATGSFDYTEKSSLTLP